MPLIMSMMSDCDIQVVGYYDNDDNHNVHVGGHDVLLMMMMLTMCKRTAGHEIESEVWVCKIGETV